jgi:hypothetical protein
MAVTADARALAAAGKGIAIGRRAHTMRHGDGRTAWRERLETEVVGMMALTTYNQYGAPEHRRQHHRCDLQANPIHAVVVRTWHRRAYGPGGKTVFLAKAAVEKPLQPFDDDDRSLMENCCIKERRPPWRLKHPPPENRAGGARARHVHGVDVCLGNHLSVAM